MNRSSICEKNQVVLSKGVDGFVPRETFRAAINLADGRVIMADRDPNLHMKVMSSLRSQECQGSTGPSALLWTLLGSPSGRWEPLTSTIPLEINEFKASQRFRNSPEYGADDALLSILQHRGFFPRTVDVPTSLKHAGKMGQVLIEGSGLTEDEQRLVVIWQS